MRIIALILTAMFGIWGYIGGIIFIICCITMNKTIAGTSYLYPLFPFNWNALKHLLFRCEKA